MERFFVLNDPSMLRVNPALAEEIGLNESMVLLQIEYWISISNNERDGYRWTRQSISDMRKKAFPFWSETTIKRTIKSLIDKGLIVAGNYNEKKYDRTRWFRINYEVCDKLR